MEAPVPDIRQLGRAIAEIREEDGVPGETLAREANVDPAHLNRAENHGRNLTWETLGALAENLGVPISRFVLRAEEIARGDAQGTRERGE
ncbi:MAG TPA: helix-turn-helix transcriptional regulator [Solirubrobacterales bacterium]|nr:helix-turn-helix transcriptional regulator [Solirubrobacterales bacterium]